LTLSNQTGQETRNEARHRHGHYILSERTGSRGWSPAAWRCCGCLELPPMRHQDQPLSRLPL